MRSPQPDELLGARERLEFEYLLQWLRLSFLATSFLVLLAFGSPAVAYALLIAAAVAASFCWVALLARFRPDLLLHVQLLLRVLDCGVVYLVLVNYHAFLHNAYYDSVYLRCLDSLGRCGPRGVRAPVRCGSGHDEPFLMDRTAVVVARRERALSAEIARRNADLERTANELAESMRLRDAMLTGVTHDLRSPITVIKVQAQLLRRRADDQMRSNIDQIERAAARMARWIDELLEVATGRTPDDAGPVTGRDRPGGHRA
jgi:signal transduction histidine kinase